MPDGALVAEDNWASCTKAHSWTGQPSVGAQSEWDLLVVEVIEAEPDPSGHNLEHVSIWWYVNAMVPTQLSFLVFGAELSTVVRQFFKGSVQAEIQRHAHGVAARQPAIGAPCSQEEHA